MNNKKVIFVSWDWFYTTDEGEGLAQARIGEEMWRYGKSRIVKEINYHTPMGEGDKHYCDIAFDNGTSFRVFNLDEIEFKDEKSNE